ncbi:MAG: hypothetical protein U0K81_07475 [Paludibacteraceae bacterium]|nr:hypothetical protein [Paludibacteraceae bacterium]
MKKVLFYLSAVCVLLSFQGCPTTPPEPVDPRDAFVGVYSYQTEGGLEANLGITTFKLPLDGTGEFTITKVGEGDQVQLIGVNDTINASVSGNNLILESNTIAANVKGYSMQLQFANTTATLTDNVLSWQTDLEAIVSVSGMNILVAGQLTMNATNLAKTE